MVTDIFANGIPRNAQSSGNDQPVTVVDLANYYYMQRINELQNTELPQLKEALLTRLEHMI